MPPVYRILQQIARFLFGLLARLDVVGIENVPRAGPLILATNHMHAFDLPVAFAVVPRRPTVFVADKWRGKVGGWIIQMMANTIFVTRGEPDREALAKALVALRAGGMLAIAPEGTRSRTGGLLHGKNGAAYLASRTTAPILPMVIWGQETALNAWAHLRRPDIRVRIAPPVVLGSDAHKAKGEQLDQFTDELMLTLARMLPPEYRGVYAERTVVEVPLSGSGSLVNTDGQPQS